MTDFLCVCILYINSGRLQALLHLHYRTLNWLNKKNHRTIRFSAIDWLDGILVVILKHRLVNINNDDDEWQANRSTSDRYLMIAPFLLNIKLHLFSLNLYFHFNYSTIIFGAFVCLPKFKKNIHISSVSRLFASFYLSIIKQAVIWLASCLRYINISRIWSR